MKNNHETLLTRALAACLLAFALCSPATATGDITGTPRIIDGDTIEIMGLSIRLHGIDAPETRQQCIRERETWECGKAATAMLSTIIDNRPVTCTSHGTDRYGRTIARCFAGQTDIEAEMVRRGFALAYRRYSERYIAEEREAREHARGLWASEFTPPWEWRKSQRQENQQRAATSDPKDCPVKGNIGSSGKKIYHIPGGQYYDRTRIDPDKGERCFRTEAEARSAGWRKSKR